MLPETRELQFQTVLDTYYRRVSPINEEKRTVQNAVVKFTAQPHSYSYHTAGGMHIMP